MTTGFQVTQIHCDSPKNPFAPRNNLGYLLPRFFCAVSSVVEHHLDMVGVTGSKPVPRTISFESKRRIIQQSRHHWTGLNSGRFTGSSNKTADPFRSRLWIKE